MKDPSFLYILFYLPNPLRTNKGGVNFQFLYLYFSFCFFVWGHGFCFFLKLEGEAIFHVHPPPVRRTGRRGDIEREREREREEGTF